MHQLAALATCAAGPEARTHVEASRAASKTLGGHAAINFARRVSPLEGELWRLAGDPADAKTARLT